MDALPENHLVLRSTVREDATVELAVVTEPVPAPGPDEVLVRVEAAPINPSDLFGLFAGADLRQARAVDGGRAAVAPLAPASMASLRPRIGTPIPAGNEGAGVVVAAGGSDSAQALLGRTVAVFGGGMYAQHRVVPAEQCLPLPDDATPAEGAACFVNPLTALGMVGTMRLDGHTALVHTAAASNLGQMLVKLCRADGVPLVNVVRRQEQAAMLRQLGAEHVCDSSSPSFLDDLTDAVGATGATIAFDAIGGGEVVDAILTAMERAATASGVALGRYGSEVQKQVHIYGGLDRSPTVLRRAYGFAWSLSGWLLMPFLQRVGPGEAQRLRQRVVDELRTTFASTYAAEISLDEAVDPQHIAAYGQMATGRKYLVNPAKA